MSIAATLTGAEGSLRWGYHSAGTVRSWRLVRGDAGAVLTGAVFDVNDFRVTQRPLMFVVTHDKGSWSWPVVSLEIQGSALTAHVGPKEKT